MRGECINCKSPLKRPLFADIECPACGATLRVDNSEAKRFIYGSEAVLIAIGFFSSSTLVYTALAVLMVAALVIYVIWSIRSPLLVLQRKAVPDGGHR